MNPIKLLDKVFSEYIRRKYSDDNGDVRCCTCSKMDHWKYMQAGHFISRGNMSLRFSEFNVHPQCPECNELKEGNLMQYRIYLENRYGTLRVAWLESEKNKEVHRTKSEIKELIKLYKRKIREL